MEMFSYKYKQTGYIHDVTLNIKAQHGNTVRVVPPKKLSFRFRISLSDMTNYKSAFGKVCRIKNRQTFKSMPILNSAYHAVKYAELRIGILLKICRFVIRHITTWYGMRIKNRHTSKSLPICNSSYHSN